MPGRIEVAPELIAECKYLYEETLTPVEEICARLGVSSRTFFLRLKEWNWARRRYVRSFSLNGKERSPLLSKKPAAELVNHATPNLASLPQVPAIANNIVSVEDGLVSAEETEQSFSSEPEGADARAALYARVLSAARLQLDTIELIQKTLRPVDVLQSERTVHIIAKLNKALCAIAAIAKPDKAIARPDKMMPSHDTDDDEIPRDIDEFRRELARRIKGLVDAERARADESSRRS